MCWHENDEMLQQKKTEKTQEQLRPRTWQRRVVRGVRLSSPPPPKHRRPTPRSGSLVFLAACLHLCPQWHHDFINNTDSPPPCQQIRSLGRGHLWSFYFNPSRCTEGGSACRLPWKDRILCNENKTRAGISITASRPRPEDSMVPRLPLVPQDRDGIRPSNGEEQGDGAGAGHRAIPSEGPRTPFSEPLSQPGCFLQHLLRILLTLSYFLSLWSEQWSCKTE